MLETYVPRRRWVAIFAVVAAMALVVSSCSSSTNKAGGTKATTLRVVDRVRKEHSVEAMAHLTCVGSTQDMLTAVLNEAKSLGIENILALRGDPPRDQPNFTPVPGGFRYAVELIQTRRT